MSCPKCIDVAEFLSGGGGVGVESIRPIQVFDRSLPVAQCQFSHSAPVVGLFEHRFIYIDQGGMGQVDYILVASCMIVGSVWAILVPQQTPRTFIFRQG